MRWLLQVLFWSVLPLSLWSLPASAKTLGYEGGHTVFLCPDGTIIDCQPCDDDLMNVHFVLPPMPEIHLLDKWQPMHLNLWDDDPELDHA